MQNHRHKHKHNISINQNYQSHQDTRYLILLSLLLSFKLLPYNSYCALNCSVRSVRTELQSLPKNPLTLENSPKNPLNTIKHSILLISSTPLYIGEDGNNLLFLVHKNPHANPHVACSLQKPS